MWFDPGQILSYGKMLNFVVGNRGGGKTFNTLELCVRQFLKNGRQFVYVRRYSNELDEVKDKIFDAIIAEGHFPNVKFEVRGRTLLINEKEAGFCIDLSTSRKLKSVAYPLVYYIVFDEFLLDKGRTVYIKDEVTVFLDLVETIFRAREGRALLLANSVTVSNIYFDYFDIRPHIGSKFTTHPSKPIIIQMYKNDEFISMKKQSTFGQLVAGTSYAAYSIENQFKNDQYDFVESMEGKSRYLYTIHFEGNSFGVYWQEQKGIFHINKKVDPSCHMQFSFTTDDHKPNLLYFKTAKQNPYIKQLDYAFTISRIRYDSLSTKNAMFSLFQYL